MYMTRLRVVLDTELFPFQGYIQNLTNLAMENDTYHELKGVKFGNRTVDNDLYQAMHNIKIKPDPNCYPPGFDHANYSGYINRKPNEGTGPGQDREGVIDLEAIMRELSEERRGKKGKRKRRNVAKEVKEPVANKEEQTNQIIRDMIVDDEYREKKVMDHNMSENDKIIVLVLVFFYVVHIAYLGGHTK
ncbi:uncharacterized protein LOC103517173 [Diaphorina citri]|uniref:Uncharacterized protein LOC103517173 n=1 Tax=Diaphorina citri TaxID=121845 RepID=A0A1S4EL08_DIACI|nr:uncharacterized protein LOC103517173 [Diaphorina citri]